jgi:predicted nuclease with RNAse H fold/dephospho-CoA kinase
LDIETTGLSHYYDYTTVVGVSIGKLYICYIRGDDIKIIREALGHSKCIVTFNGTVFDLKFLQKEYPILHLPIAHVDLRFLAKRVGLSGGQKAVEREIGIQREDEILGMTGESAPILWHRYRLGDVAAAKNLISYNHADIEGMKGILDTIVSRLGETCGFTDFPLETPFRKLKSHITWASHKNASMNGSIYVSRYKGRSGPRIKLSELLDHQNCRDFCSVGIDLTGSEARPTGWCRLAGNIAHTLRLSTDEEIIEETLKANPNVVSIDSPLSLPRGRTRATDDDPKRVEGGIMRECERELKRRGVNVYPSLIPSMQALTARGIRLATRFRQLGIPVIESYPGAAQDIMGIPRKRAGTEYLTEGLNAFGIRGAFLREPVSHDELDGITAAAVGAFFWSGKFEALGNEEEDYLIIPDLNRPAHRWRERRVVGISGEIASGKTTAAAHLAKQGFASARFSQVLELILVKRGMAVDRRNLQALGEKIHDDPGQRWLCKQLAKSIPRGGDAVIDGLRWRIDHAFFIERFGPSFFQLHVTAPLETRRDRYERAGHPAAEFDAASTHAVEAEAKLMRAHAHASIENDRDVEGFTARLDQVISARFVKDGVEVACR